MKTEGFHQRFTPDFPNAEAAKAWDSQQKAERSISDVRERLGIAQSPESSSAEKLSDSEMSALVAMGTGHLAAEAAKEALAAEGVQEPSSRSFEDGARFRGRVRTKGVELMSQAIAKVKGMSEAAQQTAAEDFYRQTVGSSLTHVRDAMSVYRQQFRGTPFGEKFKELESARLQRLGFAPLAEDF